TEIPRFDIKATAPGLHVSPGNPPNGSYARFIVSADTPGVKILLVRSTGRMPFSDIQIESSYFRIQVYQERDWLATLTSVAQVLGFPALIVLVLTELIRRRTKPSTKHRTI